MRHPITDLIIHHDDTTTGWFSRFFTQMKQDLTAPPAPAAPAVTASLGHAATFDITQRAVPLSLPNDPLLSQQWHLTGANGIDVSKVWDDYRGLGITIGFNDDGIQYTHPDLDDRYNAAIDYDSSNGSADGGPKLAGDKHATTTAGVAAGVGNNGLGVSGVAYEAGLTSFRIDFSANLTDAQLGTLFSKSLQVDVSNNSWGFGGIFTDNFQQAAWANTKAAVENLAINGRGGLGTNVVFAAGNGRESGDDVNHHNLQNSKYVISVAATDESGKYTYFSTPGAAVLVSAPGWNISSTDRTDTAGYVSGDYVGGLAGTSYSAPIVSGVVALMLDANPNLGYRDVQEILAYSAHNSDPSSPRWITNGAHNWNGGGLHFSNDYGFGLVNAHDAVRLAETWGLQSTFANMESAVSGVQAVNAAIPDNNISGITRSFNFSGTGITLDRVELDLNIAHTWIGDLQVWLTSPDGTSSLILNRPGKNPDASTGYGSSQDNVNFTLTSNAFWGEHADGTWTLKVADVDSGYTGTLQNWQLHVYGDSDGATDNAYIYTDEFSNVASAGRTLLDDSSGTDTLNAAAVTSNTVLDITPGAGGQIDGVTLTLTAATVIENVFTGDGSDTITGNDAANMIDTGRGNDMVQGNGGDDHLFGGLGTDTAKYLGAFVDYLVQILNATTLTVQDIFMGDGNEGTDTVTGFEKFLFGGVSYLFNGATLQEEGPNQPPDAMNDSATTPQEAPVTLNVLANDTDPNGDSLVVSGITGAPGHGTAVINADNTITYTSAPEWFGTDSFIYEINDGNGHTDTAQVSVTVTQVAGQTITGNGSPNTLNGGAGPDTINGNGGNDTINGKGGNDTIDGGTGNDVIHGGTGNDVIHGGSGNDTLYGDAGNDTLYSDSGSDTFIGGAGADVMNGYQFAKDTFLYQSLADAGDTINGFKRGQDVLDLRQLFDSLGYGGTNPVGDGHMLISAAGGDVTISIDADGPGGSAAVLLATLHNVNFTTLTAGTDYLVQ